MIAANSKTCQGYAERLHKHCTRLNRETALSQISRIIRTDTRHLLWRKHVHFHAPEQLISPARPRLQDSSDEEMTAAKPWKSLWDEIAAPG